MRRILIVDDSKVMGLTTKKSLEEISPEYSILYVDSGEKCLDLLKYNPFDLILLDIEMPGMTGWHVLKKLREDKKLKSIPVAFLTGREDDFSRALGKLVGNAYIEKGISIHELKEKIEYIFKNPAKIDESKEKLIENVIQKAIDQI